MTSCHQQSSSVTNTMSTSQLLDKIKGGWAGQTIGVSFGSHTEFRYQEHLYKIISLSMA